MQVMDISNESSEYPSDLINSVRSPWAMFATVVSILTVFILIVLVVFVTLKLAEVRQANSDLRGDFQRMQTEYHDTQESHRLLSQELADERTQLKDLQQSIITAEESDVANSIGGLPLTLDNLPVVIDQKVVGMASAVAVRNPKLDEAGREIWQYYILPDEHTRRAFTIIKTNVVEKPVEVSRSYNVYNNSYPYRYPNIYYPTTARNYFAYPTGGKGQGKTPPLNPHYPRNNWPNSPGATVPNRSFQTGTTGGGSFFKGGSYKPKTVKFN